ncbi:hypothetical protein [Fibrella aquatica]|uniref:hypothetical protein n=1 Tax=Fibrella aquatica TaxID=3242487 RepID=UPI003520BAFE
MKSLLNTTCVAGVFALLISTSSAASANEPTNEATRLGWVASPTASFNVRTSQSADGHLVVHISNRSQRGLTLQVETVSGADLAVIPVSRRSAQFGVKLNVSELEDGQYRLVVSSSKEKVVKLVNLESPKTVSTPSRVAVVKLAANQ